MIPSFKLLGYNIITNWRKWSRKEITNDKLINHIIQHILFYFNSSVNRSAKLFYLVYMFHSQIPQIRANAQQIQMLRYHLQTVKRIARGPQNSQPHKQRVQYHYMVSYEGCNLYIHVHEWWLTLNCKTFSAIHVNDK